MSDMPLNTHFAQACAGLFAEISALLLNEDNAGDIPAFYADLFLRITLAHPEWAQAWLIAMDAENPPDQEDLAHNIEIFLHDLAFPEMELAR